jgi:hypothetical protein
MKYGKESLNENPKGFPARRACSNLGIEVRCDPEISGVYDVSCIVRYHGIRKWTHGSFFFGGVWQWF